MACMNNVTDIETLLETQTRLQDLEVCSFGGYTRTSAHRAEDGRWIVRSREIPVRRKPGTLARIRRLQRKVAAELRG